MFEKWDPNTKRIDNSEMLKFNEPLNNFFLYPPQRS